MWFISIECPHGDSILADHITNSVCVLVAWKQVAIVVDYKS
jgi:hypothetical protein